MTILEGLLKKNKIASICPRWLSHSPDGKKQAGLADLPRCMMARCLFHFSSLSTVSPFRWLQILKGEPDPGQTVASRT